MFARPLAALVASLVMTLPAAAQDTESRVPTNGIEYNVKTWGNPQSPAVVLMHGWMGTSHTWRKIAPGLAADRFVIVPDMRGYGASDKPESGYDAVNLAADIKGLLDHFGKDRAHIVGHDMGALVSEAIGAVASFDPGQRDGGEAGQPSGGRKSTCFPIQWSLMSFSTESASMNARSQFEVCGAAISTKRRASGTGPTGRQPVSAIPSLPSSFSIANAPLA